MNIFRLPGARPTVVTSSATGSTPSGSDVVNVGNSTNGVQSIHSVLSITNPPWFTTINVNDSADTAGTIATHRFETGTGFATINALAPAPIRYQTADLQALNITLGIGPDNFGFVDTDNAPTTLNTGAGNDTVEVLRNGGPLNITSSGGTDRVNVGDNGGVQSILSSLTITNPPALTTIQINNSGDPIGRVASHTINAGSGLATISGLAPGSINYQTADLQALNITLGSGDDTFTFVNTDNAATTLNTGPGNDTVHVERTGGPLTVTTRPINGFLDTVNVGNLSNGVQGILGPLTITDPATFNSITLNINNTGDTVGRSASYTINTGTGMAVISGLAPAAISYRTFNIRALNIALGSGADAFIFFNTSAPTMLNTSAGTDTVNVERTGGALTVDGGMDDDTVNVGPALANISTLGSGLTLNGGGGVNTVNFNDTSATAATEYFLQPGSLNRNSVVRVTYGGFSNVVLDAGNFGDHLIVYAAAGTNTTANAGGGDDNFSVGLNPATYHGGPGSDTLWALDGTNFWSITGLDSGNYNGVAPFTSVESLVGNLSDDTFALSDGAGLSGFVWDRGGNATLDYSTWTTGVYVNLPTAEATNIAGGVYGIPYVIGGFSDDILVGDDVGNYLDGGPGRDLVIGGGAGYSGAPDYLVGGEGEDIVIGGFTAYDTDAGSLAAILAAWTQPTDYYERVANLHAGATAPALNETTVFYNYSFGNVLLGDADLDLFFGDPSFDTSDWDPETESLVPVF